MMTVKKCPGCGEEKPRDQYHSHRGNRDGLSSRCKTCAKKINQAYYLSHRDSIKAKCTQWALDHPEHRRQTQRKYRQDHKEKFRALYMKRTPEQRRKEYLRSQDKMIARARAWRASHPGATWEQVKAWRDRNPEAYKAIKLNDRARRAKGAGIITKDQYSQLVLSQGNRCAYCSVELTKLHVDHKIPLSRGGEHCLENLCLACPTCNAKKHNKTSEEFLAEVEKKMEVHFGQVRVDVCPADPQGSVINHSDNGGSPRGLSRRKGTSSPPRETERVAPASAG